MKIIAWILGYFRFIPDYANEMLSYKERTLAACLYLRNEYLNVDQPFRFWWNKKIKSARQWFLKHGLVVLARLPLKLSLKTVISRITTPYFCPLCRIYRFAGTRFCYGCFMSDFLTSSPACIQHKTYRIMGNHAYPAFVFEKMDEFIYACQARAEFHCRMYRILEDYPEEYFLPKSKCHKTDEVPLAKIALAVDQEIYDKYYECL